LGREEKESMKEGGKRSGDNIREALVEVEKSGGREPVVNPLHNGTQEEKKEYRTRAHEKKGPRTAQSSMLRASFQQQHYYERRDNQRGLKGLAERSQRSARRIAGKGRGAEGMKPGEP